MKELAVHASVEETVLYPTIRAAIDDKDSPGLVFEALEEHHVVKWTLSELGGMSAGLPRRRRLSELR